jgi:hypothetical protein
METARETARETEMETARETARETVDGRRATGDGRREKSGELREGAMSGGDAAVSDRSGVEFFGVVGGPAGDSGNSEKRNVCGEVESP